MTSNVDPLRDRDALFLPYFVLYVLSPSHTLCCTQGRVWWRYTVHI